MACISLPNGLISAPATCGIRAVPFSIVFNSVPPFARASADKIEEMEFETEEEALAYADQTARDMARSYGTCRPDFSVI